MDRSPDSRKDEIRSWLRRSGLFLEMEAARVLRDDGWDVNQSEPFDDPKTGKTRETDINALLQARVGDQLLCFELVVECKSSTKRPWLLLTAPTKFRRTAWGVHTAASQLGQEFMNAYMFDELEHLGPESDKVFEDLPLFDFPARTAYRFVSGGFHGTEEVEDGGADLGYAAVMQVIAALEQYNRECSGRPLNVIETICEILIPVIVVNDNLFECWSDVTGEIHVERVHDGVLVGSRELESAFSNYICVTDLTGLPDLAKRARETFLHFQAVAEATMPAAKKLLREELARMAESFRDPPGSPSPGAPRTYPAGPPK